MEICHRTDDVTGNDGVTTHDDVTDCHGNTQAGPGQLPFEERQQIQALTFLFSFPFFLFLLFVHTAQC